MEGFVHSTQCLFIFASRGEVQCRLPILRSHPLVPRRKLVSIFFSFLFLFILFPFVDTSNEPLNRSQTRRPDPFQVSAVTARGLCLYSSGDCVYSFSPVHWQSKWKEYKQVKPVWRVSSTKLKKNDGIFRTQKWRLKLPELSLKGATITNWNIAHCLRN